jgi:hypothetical protein
MGQVRDFTDEAREQMAAILRRLSQQQYGAQSIASAMDWAVNCAINCDYDRYRGIKDYYSTLSDQNLLAADALGRVFEEVYRIDSAYALKVSSQAQVAQGLKQSLAALADIIGPSQTGGLPLLAQGGPELDQALQTANNGLFQAIWELFASIDEDGNLVYDWDAIDTVLNKDAEDITEMEYLVLALLYVDMGDEDTARFISALADKVGDVSEDSTNNVTHWPSEYTTWEIDPDKVDRILGYVYAMADVACSNQTYILYYADEDELNAVFDALGLKSQVGYDIDDIKDEIYDVYDNQTITIYQQAAFLEIAKGLTTRPAGTEAGSYTGLEGFLEGGYLTGKAGAKGPEIHLVYDEENEKYTLTYLNTKVTSYGTPLAFGGVSDNWQQTFEHLNENTVVIDKTSSGIDASELVNANSQTYFMPKNPYSATDIGQEVIWSLLMKSVSTSGVPGLGTMTSFTFGRIKDAALEDQLQADYQAAFDADKQAYVADFFWLKTVVVSDDGTGRQSVMIYPGSSTDVVLINLNKYLANPKKGFVQENTDGSSSVSLPVSGLSYPITIDDVLFRPDSVNELLDAIPSNEKEKITNPFYKVPGPLE